MTMNEIRTQKIEFACDSGTTPGYLAQPTQSTGAGVVVIQEWWGLVPHIQELCERFARQGYVALAPDLYHGKAASEPDEARKLVMEMDRERAVQEIIAATIFLKGLAQVAPKKVGVVGFCMGGMLAVTNAALSDQVDATVAFYGMPRDLSLVEHIQTPLLGLFAEHDHGITPEMVKDFESTLAKSRAAHDIHVYPGTQHAFFNDTRPHIYDPQAAQDAWKRTLDWFRQHLA
jgi:carboxymethylenebutenolidase